MYFCCTHPSTALKVHDVRPTLLPKGEAQSISQALHDSLEGFSWFETPASIAQPKETRYIGQRYQQSMFQLGRTRTIRGPFSSLKANCANSCLFRKHELYSPLTCKLPSCTEASEEGPVGRGSPRTQCSLETKWDVICCSDFV